MRFDLETGTVGRYLIFAANAADNVHGEKFSDVEKFQIEQKKCTFL